MEATLEVDSIRGKRGRRAYGEDVCREVVAAVFDEGLKVREAAERAGVSVATAYKMCKASGRELPKRSYHRVNQAQRDWVGRHFAGKKGVKIQPKFAGVKTDFELKVDTSHYRRVYGKEPEGQGPWVFMMGGFPHLELGDFEAMRERVVKRAMAQGFHGEIVVRP